jgi:hypothetical protein
MALACAPGRVMAKSCQPIFFRKFSVISGELPVLLVVEVVVVVVVVEVVDVVDVEFG